jgi:hypothetical protein
LNEKCVLKMESSLFDLDVKYLKSKEVKWVLKILKIKLID